MVLLTMTSSIVEALRELGRLQEPQRSTEASNKATEAQEAQSDTDHEPSTENPEVGRPISHGQIIDLWTKLKASGNSAYSLEQLLRGAKVYVAPPPPKPEPTPEYKALMARLRRDEEARSYSQMLAPPRETFSARFPSSAQAFEAVNRPQTIADAGEDDEITYTEVHRQMMLILNFLVSIAGVAATLWVVSRWWSVPARLFLTLGGSILVAIAEVVVYAGYERRMGDAKRREGLKREVKEVVETWVVGEKGGHDPDENGDGDGEVVLLTNKEEETGEGVRKRRVELQKEN